MRRKKNILVITSWAYNDGLIQSSTLPYLRMIHGVVPDAHIYLVTEEKNAFLLNKSEKEKVNEELAVYNIELWPLAYYRFGLKKLLASIINFMSLWRIVMYRNVSHIHCFCTPAGVIGYFLSVFTGRKLVLDSYEPHAESMVENGTWKKESFAFKILWELEKKQSRQASYVIGAASGMKKYALEKYGVKLKCFGQRPTCVDLNLFLYNDDARIRIRKLLGWEDKIVAVYAGKFGGIYLDKEVFDFLKVAANHWGDRLRFLLLTSESENEIKEYCLASGYSYENIHRIMVPYTEMPQHLSVADFALTPVKPVPSKRFCSPIKDGEYWAIGLPVVIADHISDDSQIIERNNAGAVLKELTCKEYEQAVLRIDKLLGGDRIRLRENIRKLADKHRNYKIAEREYKKIYVKE